MKLVEVEKVVKAGNKETSERFVFNPKSVSAIWPGPTPDITYIGFVCVVSDSGAGLFISTKMPLNEVRKLINRGLR